MRFSIFLSHSSKDRAWVEWITQHASNIGVTVYAHEYDPQPGKYIAEKVQMAIRNSDAFVVLLTKNSQFSPFVQQEIGFAQGVPREVVSLVEPGINKDSLAMLEGREYIPFDLHKPQDGLSVLLSSLQKRKGDKELVGVFGLGVLIFLAVAAAKGK